MGRWRFNTWYLSTILNSPLKHQGTDIPKKITTQISVSQHKFFDRSRFTWICFCLKIHTAWSFDKLEGGATSNKICLLPLTVNYMKLLAEKSQNLSWVHIHVQIPKCQQNAVDFKKKHVSLPEGGGEPTLSSHSLIYQPSRISNFQRNRLELCCYGLAPASGAIDSRHMAVQIGGGIVTPGWSLYDPLEKN